MRAVSLPSFLPDQTAARTAAFALFVALLALTALLVYAVTSGGAAEPNLAYDYIQPFRWVSSGG